MKASRILTDEQCMREALREAQAAAAEREVPIGGVMVCGGRIIARAHNLTERLTDVTAHAEILAITAACNALGTKYLDDCTLYVTLEPCVMCAGALEHCHMKKVVWACADPKNGFQRFGNLLHPKTEIKTGILEEECLQLLTDFFKKKR